MEKSCSCTRCKSLCKNPGWFSPEEAEAAIKAGYADRLMMDYWVGSPNIYILCPASRGCEKDRAPNSSELYSDVPFLSMFSGNVAKGKCTLQAGNGLCSIHDSGFKPKQCRAAMACEGDTGLDNTQMGELWKTPEAQLLVRKWMKMVGLSDDAFDECF